MKREKTILVMFFIIFFLVTLETILIFFPKLKISNSEIIRISDLKSEIGNENTTKTPPPSYNENAKSSDCLWALELNADNENNIDDSSFGKSKSLLITV